MLRRIGLACLLSIVGCGGEGESTAPPLRANEASDVCHAHADEGGCNADTACGWVAVEACPTGATCPDGFCSTRDECAAHADQASCEADATCAWADVALAEACPSPDCGGTGGVCYTPGSTGGGDECLCACPLYCPEGEPCPGCECDCPAPDPGGTGGGTCTCACPACEPGAECPPCDCTCDGGGTGDECGGTCTCACPDCPPGTECPACDCSCEGGGGEPVPAPAPTCECPPCAPGTECLPCDCGTSDPCTQYTDETACTTDTTCIWYAIGAPCIEGEPCLSGVCQAATTGGDCVCACPACEPGVECPPCDCDCSGGSGGTGCAVATTP
jgi:hypothetical protein